MVIPCEINQPFPPDPHGFCWYFVKSMYPSRNENPENFISYHETFQNYDRMNYGPSSLDNKPLQFMAFWNCCYSARFNSKHLKFWMGTHFLEVFTAKNLFRENLKNCTCGGVLKLSNWSLQFFLSHLQWAITS